jgi:hypothetical protein
MNVKISQFPVKLTLKSNDSFPILSDGTNFIAPLEAVYSYLSGNQLVQVYTSYASNSSFLINSTLKNNSMYSVYNSLSSQYILNNSIQTEIWNSNYFLTNSLSANWNNASDFMRLSSDKVIFSDTTIADGASAIKNIIAITQENYNNLTFIDPQTFYVIAAF